MASREKIQELQEIARLLRIDVLQMLHKAKSGHTGGPLGMMEMMVGLYFYKMKHEATNPLWADRDRFILANGHTAPALYACLAHAGYFPKSELNHLRQLGSPLQGHPKRNPEWGIEMSTGSLGQGCSIANGIALGARLDSKNYRVYSMHSDGEAQEGMFWEGVMAAGHYKLDNRCGFLDFNGIQIDGFNKNIKDVSPLEDKFKAFHWHVISIDGNNMEEVVNALDEAEATRGKPTMIVAKTILGKGVSAFENNPAYHGVAPSDDELKIALHELREK
ncbi:MAG: transketolase [Deltaproteobacteria bacterium]|nr:transketolase [Deltaproteobacteria bacterium]